MEDLGSPWVKSKKSSGQLTHVKGLGVADCAMSPLDRSTASVGVGSDDLVGREALSHLAAFSSSLWEIPTSARVGFHGGWRWIHRRPTLGCEGWPCLRSVGIGSLQKPGTMEAKG